MTEPKALRTTSQEPSLYVMRRRNGGIRLFNNLEAAQRAHRRCRSKQPITPIYSI